MTRPMMILIADNDEMIKMGEIKQIFENSSSRVKRLRVIKGGHSSERDFEVLSQLSKFCSMIFKLNSVNGDPNYTRFRQRTVSTVTTLDSVAPENQRTMVKNFLIKFKNKAPRPISQRIR